MLIQMLTLGNVQTNVGMVDGKSDLLNLEVSGGDSEYGYYTIDYDKSPLYFARSVLDLEFKEIDLLKHFDVIAGLKDRKLISLEVEDRKTSVVEHISNHTLTSSKEDFAKEIGEVDLLGNALFSYLANVPMSLSYDVNIYYNEGEGEYSSSTGDITIEHQNGVIKFKVDLCIFNVFEDGEDNDNIEFTITLGKEEIGDLILDKDRNLKAKEMITSKLKELSEEWVLEIPES